MKNSTALRSTTPEGLAYRNWNGVVATRANTNQTQGGTTGLRAFAKNAANARSEPEAVAAALQLQSGFV